LGFEIERVCYDEVLKMSKWLCLGGNFEVKIVKDQRETLRALRIWRCRLEERFADN